MTPRDIFVRAVKTAAQAFLAVLVAAGTDYVSVATIKAAAIAGGAAAISALYNALSQGRGE